MLWKKKGSKNVPSVDIKKAMMDGRPVAMIWSGWLVRQCLHFISVASKLGELFGRDRLQAASFCMIAKHVREILRLVLDRLMRWGLRGFFPTTGHKKHALSTNSQAVWFAIFELSLTQTSAVWASRRALDGLVSKKVSDWAVARARQSRPQRGLQVEKCAREGLRLGHCGG
jgi:hypothetical protein